MKTRIYLTHPDGRVMSVREWAFALGVKEKRLRARIRQGWPDVDVLTRDMREGKWMGRTRDGHQWALPVERRQTLAYERAAARYSMRTEPRDVWDLPLASDPWAQAAIEVAAESGGFTLDEVGRIMGGISRERVRQLEEAAMAKADRMARLRGHKGGIVELLRGAAAERDLRDESEKGGYDG
jgi:hypothetical protein